VNGPVGLPHDGEAISAWIVAALVPGLIRGVGADDGKD
jgi:hypothetical protein